MQNEALCVEGLGGERGCGRELQFSVRVILDECDIVTGQQTDQFPLPLCGYGCARGVMQSGHEPACADGMVGNCSGQGAEIDAFTRMCRNFDYFEPQPFRRLQAAVEGRRFDCDGIACPRHRLQRQIQRLERS